MIKRTLGTIVQLVVITSLVALAACGASDDGGGDGRESTSALHLSATEDGGADSGNPADNSTLGAPSVVGASPVQPSPWDHLITGASK